MKEGSRLGRKSCWPILWDFEAAANVKEWRGTYKYVIVSTHILSHSSASQTHH